jgi:hypothetical protein
MALKPNIACSEAALGFSPRNPHVLPRLRAIFPRGHCGDTQIRGILPKIGLGESWLIDRMYGMYDLV